LARLKACPDESIEASAVLVFFGGRRFFCIPNRCIYILFGMSQPQITSKPQAEGNPGLPALPCMCGSFRRTARALSQLYDEALRPAGLRGTQHTILQALARTGEVTQGRLGEILAMDSTSLTRTLGIMRRSGWVAEQRGTDKRERWLSLSKAGAAKLKAATAAWEKVQAQLRGKLGEAGWKNLMQWTNETTEAAVDLIAKTGGSI
jgi:DNA-binding MarR family transcriptional regulator